MAAAQSSVKCRPGDVAAHQCEHILDGGEPLGWRAQRTVRKYIGPGVHVLTARWNPPRSSASSHDISGMTRVDVWDAAPIPTSINKLDCGFPRRSIESKYRIGKEIGQGGFGSVRIIEDLSNNRAQFAVKSIRKSLDIPNVTAAQLERHLENIRREVQVLRKLRGTVRGGSRGKGERLRHMAVSWRQMTSGMPAAACDPARQHGNQCHVLIGSLRAGLLT